MPVPEEFEGYTSWSIHSNMDVHWDNTSEIVSKAKVTLTCSLCEWLPQNCSEKLKQHEDGHRQIVLILYQKGDAIAKELAQKYLMNKPWHGGQASKDFDTAYQHEVFDVIKWLNAKYDEITNHGSNSVDSKEAVQEAFKICYATYRPYLADQ
jgi:hypothetical protein